MLNRRIFDEGSFFGNLEISMSFFNLVYVTFEVRKKTYRYFRKSYFYSKMWKNTNRRKKIMNMRNGS